MNSDGHLLYLLRFLNVLFLAALVWLSFLAAREFFFSARMAGLVRPSFGGVHPAGHVLRDRE